MAWNNLHVDEAVVGEHVGLDHLGVVEVDVITLDEDTDGGLVESSDNHSVGEIIGVSDLVQGVGAVKGVSAVLGAEIELATYRSAPVSSSLDSSPASSKALVEGARQVTFLEWSRAGQSPVAFKALSKPSSLSSLTVTVRTVTEQGLGGRRTLRVNCVREYSNVQVQVGLDLPVDNLKGVGILGSPFAINSSHRDILGQTGSQVHLISLDLLSLLLLVALINLGSKHDLTSSLLSETLNEVRSSSSVVELFALEQSRDSLSFGVVEIRRLERRGHDVVGEKDLDIILAERSHVCDSSILQVLLDSIVGGDEDRDVGGLFGEGLGESLGSSDDQGTEEGESRVVGDGVGQLFGEGLSAHQRKEGEAGGGLTQ